MSKYFIHEGNVREYTKTGHKWLSPLAIVRKLNKLEKENAELKSKVERLENCIITMHHEEYSNSPDEIKKYIKQIYTGQHDQYFEATIKECLKEWGEGE